MDWALFFIGLGAGILFALAGYALGRASAVGELRELEAARFERDKVVFSDGLRRGRNAL